MKLFREHPEVETRMQDLVLRRGSKLQYSPKICWEETAREFREICREEGVPRTGYPFNVGEKGIRAIAAWFRRSRDKMGRAWTRTAYGESAARNWDPGYPNTGHGAVDANFVVMVDEWTIDTASLWKFEDGTYGLVPRFSVINVRLWGLSAVLASEVVLKTHPDRFDYLRAIESAIRPHMPIEFTVPGFRYPKCAYRPSQYAELAWWVPDVFSVDNAKIHRAEDVVDAMTRTLGCSVRFGIVKRPRSRGPIENFNNFLSSRFKRLATGTGSGPSDPHRGDPEKAAVSLKMEVQHVRELIEVLVAEFNTTAKDSLRGNSPMEHIRDWLDTEPLIRTVPEDQQNDNFTLSSVSSDVVIRLGGRGEKVPYVQFEGAKYRGDVLKKSRHRAGETVRFRMKATSAHQATIYLQVYRRWFPGHGRRLTTLREVERV